MNPILVLVYAVLIFLATFVASIPFGVVQGFTKARGTPLSERTLALLKVPEYLTEVAAVIFVIANLSARQPQHLVLNAVSAVLVSALITFFAEVRSRLMSLREFGLRVLLGFVVCIPIGLLIGAGVNTGG
jgi:hypothetical protein